MDSGGSERSAGTPRSEPGSGDLHAHDLVTDGDRLVGLALSVVFWYALTENLRRLDTLKETVAEGSRRFGVHGYREIGAIRTVHHERRAQRALPFPLAILPRSSPTWWLAHGIPVLFGSTWLVLIAVAIVTAV